MNWIGFSQPIGAALAALAVPLVILYFLKLKRPRRTVPSLVLWRQVMADQRVNSPFQRFRQNILLWLQLAVLACLILAATQPYISSGADRAEYLPVLIDCSASMGARDSAGGPTRLQMALQRVSDLIENLPAEQRLSLIAVSHNGRRLTDFTDNKRLLNEALSHVTLQDVPSRLEEGLRLVQALSRTYSFRKVLFLTDGNLPGAVDFELPFDLKLELVGKESANLAITELNARRNGERWDIFTRIEATKPGGGTALVEFYRGEEKLGDEQLSLEAGEARRLLFRVDGKDTSRIEARLVPQQFDSLESDNRAWVDLPMLRPLTVYISPTLRNFREALIGIKNLQIYPAPGEAAENATATYDLVFSDQTAEKTPAGQVAMFVGQIPAELQNIVKIETDLTRVVDWQRNAPLLTHVQLGEVQFSDKPVITKGTEEREFEQRGFQILAQSASGPLILGHEVQGRRQYWMLFHTERSTLPFRVAFPILTANAVQEAFYRTGLAEATGQRTGVFPPRAATPERVYLVEGPESFRQTLRASKEGVLSGISAPRVGDYVVTSEGRVTDQIAAGLLNAHESLLTQVESIQFREVSVSATQEKLQTDRPLWGYLALLGLSILTWEWWWFQRRPGGWNAAVT